MAAVCASVGFWVVVALGAAAGAAAFAGADAAGAGAVVVSVFGAAAGAGAGAGSMAFTACLQAPESFDMFFCRHWSEAAPPGGTLAQFAS